MAKILYVYGYGGSPAGSTATTLRRLLPQHELFCMDYPQYDGRLAHAMLCHFVKSEQVPLVVASSLGAFLTLAIPDVDRIVINPCMLPTVELPKIRVSRAMCATYAPFERQVMYPDADTARRTVGVFSTRDELLGDRYSGHFASHYGRIVFTDRCGHKSNVEMLRNDVLPLIEEALV